MAAPEAQDPEADRPGSDRPSADPGGRGAALIAPLLTGLAVGAVAASVAFLAFGSPGPGASAPSSASGPGSTTGAESAEEPPRSAARLSLPEHTRWIAAGGGAEPASNQVSLEQDLLLAREALGPDGVLLHGGGAGVDGVQVAASASDPRADGDPVLLRLGDLLDPRDGREARYRPSRIEGAGAATIEHLRRALASALAEDSSEPLLLYLAGHGEPGEVPRDNLVRLWGGWGLTTAELAETLDRDGAGRRVRVIIAACFSGGFAELAFAEADAEQGAAPTDRCGLFATTWDRESSGCDPNPSRDAQEGYSLHFLHALRGEDREGRRLPGPELDLDSDGRVSLLEAHTRARIESMSIDVPTTTSEEWLRSVAPERGPVAEVSLPEEEAVVHALSERLGTDGRDAVAARLDEIARLREEQEPRLSALEDEADARWATLRIGLLERWPVLDDPFHPAFQTTLREGRGAIERYLFDSPEALAWATARRALEGSPDGGDPRREVEESHLLRLARAQNTLRLASLLRAQGGESWARYARFLACERSGPP